MERAELELVQYQSRGVRIAELRSVLNRVEQDRSAITFNMQQMNQEIYRESYEELQKQEQQFQEKVMTETEQKVRMAINAVKKGELDYHAAVDNAHKLRAEIGEAVAAAELLASRRKELDERLRRADQPSVASMKALLDNKAAEFARLEQEARKRDSEAEEKLKMAESAQ